jgi:phosphate transport system protein
VEQHEHIVSSYEEELSSLNNKMAKMGGLAEEMVAQSLDALEKRNRRLAQSIIAQDDAIDAIEHEIEQLVTRMIVKRQPVAYDLRQVLAPLRISTDLERIGDLAKNIAKRTIAVGSESALGVTVGLLHTGHHYPDNLSEDGLIYHYPSTSRPASRDAAVPGQVSLQPAANTLAVPKS